jgi:hypothetical protein
MQSCHYSYSFSKFALYGFGFLYLILPIGIQYFIGANFYLYSNSQHLQNFASIFSYIILCFFVFLATKSLNSMTHKNTAKNTPDFSIFVYINYLLVLNIIVTGLILRINGAGRMELVEALHADLFPGYSLILLAAVLSSILRKNSFHLGAFTVLSIAIDFIYMGKLYSFISFMAWVFYLDINQVKITYSKAFILAILGFGFLFAIFFSRSFVTDGEISIISAYSIFSEFLGVNASIGWAAEYSNNSLPIQLNDFSTALEPTFIAQVGHGLALSFPAYFIGNFGVYWVPFMLLYFLIVFISIYLANKNLGPILIFVILYNYQHLMRHGPDIFIYKILFQIVFLLTIFNYKNILRACQAKPCNSIDPYVSRSTNSLSR